MRVNINFAMVSLMMVLCTIIGVYGLVVNDSNGNGTTYLTLIATLVGPLIGILWNNLATRRIKQHVEVIEKNTNGTMTALTNDIPVQVKQAVTEALDQKGDTNADEHNH